MKHIKNLIICIIVFLPLIGGYCIHHSFDLNENVKGRWYEFYIHVYSNTDEVVYSNTDEVIDLDNFCFFYDFSNDKGVISFKSYDPLNRIKIKFPSNIDNETLNIYSKRSGKKIYFVKNGIQSLNANNMEVKELCRIIDGVNLDNPYPNTEFTEIDLSLYNTTNNDNFIVEFKSNLKPDGIFYFFNNRNNRLSQGSKGMNINFILGDDYEGSGNYISDLKNIEEARNSFDDDLKLNFADNDPNLTSQFKLSSIDRKILNEKSLYFAIGILLISIPISALISIILTIIRCPEILREKSDEQDAFSHAIEIIRGTRFSYIITQMELQK